MREVRKTNCHFCGYLCAFHATVEDGRVVDLEPDPSRYPYDPKVLAGCRRWKMNLDVLDGDDRVNYPLRRVGERGANNWERVSWDEALDDIAQRLSKLRDQYGSETLASMIGGPHASFWPLHRFMNMFGSPNNMGIGQICWNPRIWMDALTFGWTIEADINDDTECVFIALHQDRLMRRFVDRAEDGHGLRPCARLRERDHRRGPVRPRFRGAMVPWLRRVRCPRSAIHARVRRRVLRRIGR